MKFTYKLFFSITALLTAAFMLFGSFMLFSYFNRMLERETEQGKRENLLFQTIYDMVYQNMEKYGAEFAGIQAGNSATERMTDQNGMECMILETDGTITLEGSLKLPQDEIVERTVKLMEMVGLPQEFLDRYPNHLSGGQQQRIGVARAFAMDPGIILMDEPFSALDPITRSQLQDELVNLQAKLRKTIVFVTHDMDEAVKIADRICILHSGDILQYDTPENILKNPADGFVSEFVGSKRIWSSPELIKAKDIMIRTPKITYPDVPMLKCIEKMRIENVDSLLVVDENEHLLGIIRARSIHAAPDKSEPVYTVMKPAQATADPNENIVALLKKVNSNNISNVPVVDENKRLLGLITNSSLVTTMSQQFIDFEEGEA